MHDQHSGQHTQREAVALDQCIHKHDCASLSCATMQPCKYEDWDSTPHLSFINYGHKVSQDALVRCLIINACTDEHSSCQGQINGHACHKTALISNQLVLFGKTK